jgi:hypothetical protein
MLECAELVIFGCFRVCLRLHVLDAMQEVCMQECLRTPDDDG